MCRYIMADQFLGATFLGLIRKNMYKIEFSNLYEIEKKVDKTIREKHNAMLCVSMNEMYSIVENYNDFFQVKKNHILIRESLQKKLHEEDGKNQFIAVLNSYFMDGMPIDISKTVVETLDKVL